MNKIRQNNSLKILQLKPLKLYILHFTRSLNDPLVSFMKASLTRHDRISYAFQNENFVSMQVTTFVPIWKSVFVANKRFNFSRGVIKRNSNDDDMHHFKHNQYFYDLSPGNVTRLMFYLYCINLCFSVSCVCFEFTNSLITVLVRYNYLEVMKSCNSHLHGTTLNEKNLIYVATSTKKEFCSMHKKIFPS